MMFLCAELFIDSNKSIYSGLNLKRFSWISILTALFSSESRAAMAKVGNYLMYLAHNSLYSAIVSDSS